MLCQSEQNPLRESRCLVSWILIPIWMVSSLIRTQATFRCLLGGPPTSAPRRDCEKHGCLFRPGLLVEPDTFERIPPHVCYRAPQWHGGNAEKTDSSGPARAYRRPTATS